MTHEIFDDNGSTLERNSQIVADDIINSFWYEKSERIFSIRGGWGSGKTFFVKEVIKKIKKKQPQYTIHAIDSWLGDTPLHMFQLISNTILTPVQYELMNYWAIYTKHSRLIWLIVSVVLFYIRVLGYEVLFENQGKDFLDTLLDHLGYIILFLVSGYFVANLKTDLRRPNQLKQYLQSRIQNNTIVVLDDIDRLSPELLNYILMMVHNALDHGKIKIILVYDADVVTKKLASLHNIDSKDNSNIHEDFIEKISEYRHEITPSHKNTYEIGLQILNNCEVHTQENQEITQEVIHNIKEDLCNIYTQQFRHSNCFTDLSIRQWLHVINRVVSLLRNNIDVLNNDILREFIIPFTLLKRQYPDLYKELTKYAEGIYNLGDYKKCIEDYKGKKVDNSLLKQCLKICSEPGYDQLESRLRTYVEFDKRREIIQQDITLIEKTVFVNQLTAGTLLSEQNIESSDIEKLDYFIYRLNRVLNTTYTNDIDRMNYLFKNILNAHLTETTKYLISNLGRYYTPVFSPRHCSQHLEEAKKTKNLAYLLILTLDFIKKYKRVIEYAKECLSFESKDIVNEKILLLKDAPIVNLFLNPSLLDTTEDTDLTSLQDSIVLNNPTMCVLQWIHLIRSIDIDWSATSRIEVEGRTTELNNYHGKGFCFGDSYIGNLYEDRNTIDTPLMEAKYNIVNAIVQFKYKDLYSKLKSNLLDPKFNFLFEFDDQLFEEGRYGQYQTTFLYHAIEFVIFWEEFRQRIDSQEQLESFPPILPTE